MRWKRSHVLRDRQHRRSNAASARFAFFKKLDSTCAASLGDISSGICSGSLLLPPQQRSYLHGWQQRFWKHWWFIAMPLGMHHRTSECISICEQRARCIGATEKNYVFLTCILTFGSFLANFERLVLGSIEPKFCKLLNTRLKALDEIYKIYTLLHRSTLKISAQFRQTFFRIFTIL